MNGIQVGNGSWNSIPCGISRTNRADSTDFWLLQLQLDIYTSDSSVFRFPRATTFSQSSENSIDSSPTEFFESSDTYLHNRFEKKNRRG